MINKRYLSTLFIRSACAVLIALIGSHAIAADAIVIHGVEKALEDNIRLHIGAEADAVAELTPIQIEELLQPHVQQALQAFGYYQPQIQYIFENDAAVLDIALGPRVRWQSFDLQLKQNDQTAVGSDLVQQILGQAGHPFKKGDGINHKTYDEFKRDLLARVYEQGYMDARYIRSRLEINPQALSADVHLQIELGERFYVRAVEFSGSDIQQELLQRVAAVELGKIYNADDVGRIYNRLANSGYFASITVETQKISSDGVKLNVVLLDRPKHRFSVGAGFGTDTGPRLKFNWQRPAVNEKGHSQTSEVQLSKVLSEITNQYRIPWNHPQNRYISWDSGYQYESTDEVDLQVLTTGLSFHQLFSTGGQFSTHIDLESEKAQSGDAEISKDTYVLTGVSWSDRRFRGDAVDPDLGFKYWASLLASNEALGSDANFYRVQGGVSGLIKFFDRHTLAAKTEVGKVFSNDFFSVPVSQRFFTGGDQTLRGFEYQTIAARDADSNLIGGQRLSTTSFEYRYRWSKQWQFALFRDWGRSFLDPNTNCDACVDRGGAVRKSAGIGVRWTSPVGLVSLDIAKPDEVLLDAFGNELNDDKWRLHLYIGNPL